MSAFERAWFAAALMRSAGRSEGCGHPRWRLMGSWPSVGGASPIMAEFVGRRVFEA
jgi:hypothetical protein